MVELLALGTSLSFCVAYVVVVFLPTFVTLSICYFFFFLSVFIFLLLRAFSFLFSLVYTINASIFVRLGPNLPE